MRHEVQCKIHNRIKNIRSARFTCILRSDYGISMFLTRVLISLDCPYYFHQNDNITAIKLVDSLESNVFKSLPRSVKSNLRLIHPLIQC